MIEFLIGFACGAGLVTTTVVAGWLGTKNELRSVPAPKEVEVPVPGQSWVLRGEESASAVIINAVIDGQVFYAYLGQPERNLSAKLFTRIYRRVA